MATDKVHQTSNTHYQIRVDGKPIYYPISIDEEAIGKWLEACEEHPDCYVDIVSVRTEIVVNLYNYDRMKKHFAAQASS